MDEFILGITHADGLAAEAVFAALHDYGIEKESIRAYSMGESAGNRIAYGDQYVVTLDQTNDSFDQCSLVMQLEQDDSLSVKISSESAILIKQGGDLYFADDEDESNTQLDYSQNVFELVETESFLILKLLQKLHQTYTVLSVQVSVLEPACSQGKAGVDELASQTVSLLNTRPVEPKVFPVQQAFNVFANKDQNKAVNISNQVKAYLGEETSSVQVQLVQVPVFYGMTLMCSVQCEYALNQPQLESYFTDLAGIQLVSDQTKTISPVTSLQDDSLATISQLFITEQNVNNTQFVLTADHLRHGTAKLFLNAMLVIRKTFL